MVVRTNVEFEVERGDRLQGWLFIPPGVSGPRPAISMAHGYAGVREQGIEPFARAFAEAGFVVLLYPHRNLRATDGAIRPDAAPSPQRTIWCPEMPLLL